MTTRITTRRTHETAVIEVDGDLDLQVAPELAAAMAVARIECERIVLDLRSVPFIDSTGLRELLGQQATTVAAGRRLQLVRPDPPGDRIFSLTETDDAFAWISQVPGDGGAEPLPRRVARHRTALRAIEDLAVVGHLDDIARLISDAVGDACVINRVDGELAHPVAVVHRVREAERTLRSTLAAPAPVNASSLMRETLERRAPVYLAHGDPIVLLSQVRRFQRTRGVAAVACLPLGPPATPSGLLGCSRDAGHESYDAEDRVFLQRAARALSTSSTFAAAASG